MISRFKRHELGLWLILMLAYAGMAWADPPTRVGRLNYMSGEMSFSPAGVDQWVNATLNYPLTTGDRLWTDTAARAEMHIGSMALRMDQRTELDVLNLDDNTVQLRLPQGTLNIRLQDSSADQHFEVGTPAVAISLLRPGRYRVEVDGGGNSTRIKVLEGAAEVTSSGTVFTVHEDQVALISGINYDVGSTGPPDAFDDWCLARDRREEEEVRPTYQYVSPAMTGYEDLAPYGSWRVEPNYGPVWIPAVAVDWAPYRYGHWAWVGPWGWTWIDDAPWGFAPFHYGRWVYIGRHWAWLPGARVAAPVYAPALVAFIGNVSLAVGMAARPVGWCPLGPGEWYIPHYPTSDIYIRNINITHVTHVTNVNIVKNIQVNPVNYINSNAPGGVTVVPGNVFVNAQPVRNTVIPITKSAIAQARVVGMTAPLAPRLESVLARPMGSAMHAVQPPPTVAHRPVTARLAPPPAKIPFKVQEPLLATQPGKPLNTTTLERLRPQATVTSPPVVSPAVRPEGQAPHPLGLEQRRVVPVQPVIPHLETGGRPAARPEGQAPHPPGLEQRRVVPAQPAIPHPETGGRPAARPEGQAPHPSPGLQERRAVPPPQYPPAVHPDRPARREMAPPVQQPAIKPTTPFQPADKKPSTKQPIPGGDNKKQVPEQPSQ